MGLLDFLKKKQKESAVSKEETTFYEIETLDAKQEAPPPAEEEPAEEEAEEEEQEPQEPAGPTFEQLNIAFQKDPKNVELAYETMMLAKKEGRAYDALQVQVRLGYALHQSDPATAIKVFQGAADSGHVDESVRFTLAGLYKDAGQLQQAEATIRSILRGDLNHLEALRALTDILIERENYKDALLTCNKMVTIDPRDAVAREKLGNVNLAMGDGAEAIKSYVMAAFQYASMQDKDKAIELYQKVLEIDPVHPTAARELANLLS